MRKCTKKYILDSFWSGIISPNAKSNTNHEFPNFAKPINNLLTELTEWFDRYTDPKHDGSKQLVKGRGQLDIIQSERESFAQDVTFLSE